MTSAGTHLEPASFEPASRADWQRAVAAVLRRSGALAGDAPDEAAESALATSTYEGITVQPLYTAQDRTGAGPVAVRVQATGAGWDVRARHADPDADLTARAALDDLENGATSLWLVVGDRGVPLGRLDDALHGVHLDLAPVVLDAGPDAAAAGAEFLDLVDRRGTQPEGANLGADPIGLQARTGAPADLSVATGLAGRCLHDHPGIRAITVDATVYHDAGGAGADELGLALATGLAYVRALTDAGLSVEQAFDQLDLRLSASADQFLTIATFRAARRAWARVGEVCGVAGRPQRLHAVTSAAMTSRRDPWVNMLRATLACFGAGVGGADAVTVRPFDSSLGLPDDLARRIARNTSSLLVLESHVARVADPAGGSWYVERLTDELAAAAWDRFTQIERAGGIVAALGSGLVRRQLDGVWSARAQNLARRRDRLTGVSEFPSLDEVALERRPAPEASSPEGGLPVRRYAEAYERLRDAADAATSSRGSRPAVFVAAIGPAGAYTAPVAFAAGLFQAGGLATPTGSGGVDATAVAAGFRDSGAAAAVLASSDAVYAEHAEAVVQALRAAGAQHLWLVGGPRELAGVDGYAYPGVDVLAVLREAHAVTGIAEGTPDA